MGNPILSARDSRYGLTPDVLVSDSSVHPFLSEVLTQIKSAEPTAVCVEAPDLHMSLGEIFFSPSGRKGKLSSQQVREFYRTVRDSISDFNPINLSLFGIIPALDPVWAGHDKQSVSIIAAFLPNDSSAIYKLTDEIHDAAQRVREKNHLGVEGPRVGPRKVLLVTLARLMREPRKIGEKFPILSLLNKINTEIPQESYLILREVNIVSTTPVNYVLPKGYVTLAPQIPLSKSERSIGEPTYLRPYKVGK